MYIIRLIQPLVLIHWTRL